jgi:hypothetical protein
MDVLGHNRLIENDAGSLLASYLPPRGTFATKDARVFRVEDHVLAQIVARRVDATLHNQKKDDDHEPARSARSILVTVLRPARALRLVLVHEVAVRSGLNQLHRRKLNELPWPGSTER